MNIFFLFLFFKFFFEIRFRLLFFLIFLYFFTVYFFQLRQRHTLYQSTSTTPAWTACVNALTSASIPSRSTASSRRERMTFFIFLFWFLIRRKVFSRSSNFRERSIWLCVLLVVFSAATSAKNPFKSAMLSKAKTLNRLSFYEKIETPTERKIAAVFIYHALASNTIETRDS